jgi:hypothetical protein
MLTAKHLKNTDIKSWRQLAMAFYALAHNDYDLWNDLPVQLKHTDVGIICEQYLKTKNSDLIEEAGYLLAGKYWYTALGR